MQAIFDALFGLHAVVPALFVVLLANGVGATATYCAVRRLPFDIAKVKLAAVSGDSFARYALMSYRMLLVGFALTLLFVIWRAMK